MSTPSSPPAPDSRWRRRSKGPTCPSSRPTSPACSSAGYSRARVSAAGSSTDLCCRCWRAPASRRASCPAALLRLGPPLVEAPERFVLAERPFVEPQFEQERQGPPDLGTRRQAEVVHDLPA